MLRIVYPVCCGMDIHKSFVVACVASTDSQGVTTYKSKRFSTFTGDLRRCVAWLSENDCRDVCMESTGKYWIPIYNILESTCKIVLAHPKYVKRFAARKPTKRTQNGLPTSSSTTLFPAVLFHPPTSANSGIWCATTENSQTSPPEKRTARRIV